MEEVVGAGVFREVGGHGPQHAQVVGLAGDVREEVTNPEAALAVLPELPGRFEDGSDAVELSLFDPSHGLVGVLAMVLRQQRLVIEAVHLRHSPFHEQEKNTASLGWKMRTGERARFSASDCGGQLGVAGLGKQGPQGQGPESVGCATQEFPTAQSQPGSS